MGTFTEGTSTPLPKGRGSYTTSCTSDAYYKWLWQTNNSANQVTAAGCATAEPECTTIAWGSTAAAPAFCGTATMDGYSQLGCYPTADCETLGGTIPGSTTVSYVLECGATQLIASTLTVIAIAA